MIRDMMFADRRHFGELLANSEEGIAPWHPRPPGSKSVFDRLQAAYEAELAKGD